MVLKMLILKEISISGRNVCSTESNFTCEFLSGIGPFVEVAFFHKKSKTLLVTDAVIYVPEKPPEVVGKEALLDAAKNGLAVKILSAGKEVPNDPIVDDSATRQRGTILQGLYFDSGMFSFQSNHRSENCYMSGSCKICSRDIKVLAVQAGNGWCYRFCSLVLLTCWSRSRVLQPCRKNLLFHP